MRISIYYIVIIIMFRRARDVENIAGGVLSSRLSDGYKTTGETYYLCNLKHSLNTFLCRKIKPLTCIVQAKKRTIFCRHAHITGLFSQRLLFRIEPHITFRYSRVECFKYIIIITINTCVCLKMFKYFCNFTT